MSSKNGHLTVDPDDFILEDPEEIFALDHPVEERVLVPEWQRPGQPVPRIILRGMDGEARRAFEDKGINPDRFGQDDYLRQDWWTKQRRYELVVRSAVRRDGSPLFTMDYLRRMPKLQAKPIERLFQAAQRVNGYDAEDLKSRKNSVATEEAGTLPTALPPASANATSVNSSEV